MALMEKNSRIDSIKIENLFGIYNHEVKLSPERITVIHGPNGVGKTVFLKLIHAFLKGNYSHMAKYSFSLFQLSFEDGLIIAVKSTEHKNNQRKFEVSTNKNKEKSLGVFSVDSKITLQHAAHEIAEMSPFLRQVGPETWVDRRTDTVFSARDIIDNEDSFFSLDLFGNSIQENSKNFKTIKNSLRGLLKNRGVHLIEAQRLILLKRFSAEWHYQREDPATTTVQEYARDLKKRLESALANYAKYSQKLDQSFPKRLLTTPTTLTIDQLKAQMEEVDEIRAKLRSIGLLDPEGVDQKNSPLKTSELKSLQDNQRFVMSVYIQDTKDKLGVLKDLSDRINILLSVLNKKFINKKLRISRERGLEVFGVHDNESIPVTALSSGEQHEIVLLYDLLFKVEKDTLVLIDEPELSLHISWQAGFITDLLKIIKVANFDVLMATHSPYIVGTRSDLLVDLKPEVV